MVKVLSFLAFLALVVSVLIAYAQQSQDHHHRMSPQVHRCMKVMEDPKHMEEMMRYMMQERREMMKQMFERNSDMKKMMEEMLR